jgi:hypothetical protein
METAASTPLLYRKVADAGDPRIEENYEVIKRIL